MRGSPIWEDQGEYIDMTVWEQIDNGVPWTITRKFLLIVPIALCVSAARARSPFPARCARAARARAAVLKLSPPALPPPSALAPAGSS